MELPENISAGESFWAEIRNVTLDSAPVLTGADVDSFTFDVLDAAGVSLGITGAMAPHPTIPQLWRGKIVVPTAQRVIVTATATRGTSEGYWESETWIHPRS